MRRPLLLFPLAFAVLQAQSPLTWTTLGPRAINGRTTSLESGKLQAFAASATDPRILYAAGLGPGNQGPYTGGGVFKSTDAGAYWTSVNNGLTDHFVNELWVDAADSNLVLAGTEYAGICRSTDGAATWNPTGNYTAASEFLTVGNALLAGVNSGIVRSTDAGVTWAPIVGSNAPVRTISAAGSAIAAGTDSGAVLLQSQPDTPFQPIMQTPNRDVWSVAINPANPANLFAVLGIGAPSVLMMTTNAGATREKGVRRERRLKAGAVDDCGHGDGGPGGGDCEGHGNQDVRDAGTRGRDGDFATPATPAGQLIVPVAPLAATATIGGRSADVLFAGVISPGLYQLNVTVPDVTDGSATLTVQVAGATTPGVIIPIAR